MCGSSGTALQVGESITPGWTGYWPMPEWSAWSVSPTRSAWPGSAQPRLLEKDGVLVEVAHPRGSGGGLEELLEDFTALVATFAGRMYGIRSKKAQRRLLAQAQQKVSGDDKFTG